MGRIRGQATCAETMPDQMRDRILKGELVLSDLQWFIFQYDQIIASCNGMKRWVQNVNNFANITCVTQRFEITAAHLSTKDVANDILITTGSPIDFRWNVAVFPHSISVGFGESVEPWVKLNDTTHNNDAFRKEWSGTEWVDVERSGLCLSVFEEPTQLQCYEWDSHILKPKAWVIGQTVQLIQLVTDKVVLP